MRLRNLHQGPSWTRLDHSVITHLIPCLAYTTPGTADQHQQAKVSLVGVFVPSLSSCATVHAPGQSTNKDRRKLPKWSRQRSYLDYFALQKRKSSRTIERFDWYPFAGSETRRTSSPYSYMQLCPEPSPFSHRLPPQRFVHKRLVQR